MRVLLRCDGGPGIGVGHVVRCLALAEEAIARGHTVDLLGAIDGDFLTELVESVGSSLRVLGPAASNTVQELARAAMGYDILHVDHYLMPGDILAALERLAGQQARPLLSNTADGGFGARPADLLIDPTVDAQWSAPAAAAAWHLRGARHVVLRRAVVQRAEVTEGPSASGPTRVLVVMGGADPLQSAPRVVDALAATGLPLDVTVIATEQTAGALGDRAENWPAGRLTVTGPLRDLPEAMSSADLVVTAAGTSVWELCALRRPMAVVAVVENQMPGYQALLRRGAALGLGTTEDLTDTQTVAAALAPVLRDPERRGRLSESAGQLVDGLGAWRLVSSWELMRSGAAMVGNRETLPDVRIRPAVEDDVAVLWEWRNDPATRASSRSPEEVPFDAHTVWFHSTLVRSDRYLLVGELEGQSVGTIRWDAEDDGEWEVSITVAPEHRGRGLAAALLGAGERWLAARRSEEPTASRARGDDPAAYLAAVHVDNAPSRALFLRSGYLPDLAPDGDGFERFVKLARRGPS